MTAGRSTTWRAAAAMALVTLLLNMPLAPAGAETVSSQELEWWGTTQVGQGFHLRVPVTVQNHHDFPLTNGVVLAEVDVAQKLAQAGWVSQTRSGAELLRSFELDEASVRVVAMTDLKSMAPGSIHGTLGLYSSSYPPGDLRRHEVPSTHFAGSLAGTSANLFDNRTNPYITVLWRVLDTLQPGQERHFMIYFDSKTNGEHTPPAYRDVPGAGLLERTFWSGPGMDLVGFVAPGTSQPGSVRVFGLHDETTVQVLIGNNGVFSVQPPQSTHDNPFTIGKHASRDIAISNTFGAPFRLVSDKPILAIVSSEGFVPTTRGDVVGSEFLFASTYSAQSDQDSLFFFNHHPNRDATTIRLDQLAPDGSVSGTQTIRLNGGQNHFPYTIGSHAYRPNPQGGTCTFPTDGRMANIAPGRNTYRAVVESGGPVSLQMQPVTGVTQIPTTEGAATGTEFWSALSRTTASGANCAATTTQYNVFSGSAEATHLGITSPESPLARVVPACAEAPCQDPGVPIGPPPDMALAQRTFAGTEEIPDRPLRFETGAPSWLMVSPQQSATLADAPLRGPLGGAEVGQQFVGFGSRVNGPQAMPYLYSLFADTAVKARIHYSASGTVDVPINLPKERITTLPERAGDPILWYILEANRPMVVLPQGAAPGILAGMPATLATTVHDADYRGHLVEIVSTTGLNPVSGSTVPGEPITYTFTVTNRGRGAGGEGLPDTIDLDVLQVPAGWTASLSRSNVQLGSGKSAAVQMVVNPALDAEPGQLGAIRVQVTSQGNDRVSHAADTVTHVKRSFGLGVWFDDPFGPKLDRRSGPAGEPIEYKVVVQNLGTVADLVDLVFTPPEGDWDVRLLQGAQEAPQIELAPRAMVNLTLRVTPPAGLLDGLLQTTITAQSTSSPAVVDRVFALSRIQSASDFVLEVQNRTQWLEPGGEAVFAATLRNDGGPAEAIIDMRADLLPGWTAPTAFLRHPESGARLPLSEGRLSIERGQEVRIGIAMNASLDAVTGDQVSTRLKISASGEEGGVEVFLHAIVRPHHRLEVEGPPGPVQVARGGTMVPVEIQVTNSGNMDERLFLHASELPAGWNLTFPADEVFLPRNGSQTLSVQLTVPEGTPEGAYPVAIGLASKDGAQTEFQWTVHVGSFLDFAVEGPDSRPGQPGHTVRAAFVVRNQGNTPFDVTVEPDKDEPWGLDVDAGSRLVPPGADVSIPVYWRVPAGAPDGTTRHSAGLLLQPTHPDVASIRHPLAIDIDIGRPVLRVMDVVAFQGAAGQVVQAVVKNEGDRPAYQARVELRVGTDVVDQVVLAEVPPGSIHNVTLLQPEGRSGLAMVVVASGATAVGATPGAASLAVPVILGKEAPGISIGMLLASLLVVLAGCRDAGRLRLVVRNGLYSPLGRNPRLCRESQRAVGKNEDGRR